MVRMKRMGDSVSLFLSQTSLLSKALAVYRKTERKVEVVIGIQSVCFAVPNSVLFFELAA